MAYRSKYYDNFNELLEGDRQTANLLLDELGLDTSDIGNYDWMDDVLVVYPTVEEYCEYELVDGWYMKHDLGGDFGGAPNPMDYIDTEHLGEDLIEQVDSSVCLLLPNGKVVTTSYGW